MGSIQKVIGKNGSIIFRVAIRKKGHEHISKSFTDETTAKIYISYKEQLIDEMRDFELPREALYTIEDIFIMKFGVGAREILESKGYFIEWWNTPLHEFTYDKMMEHSNNCMMKKIQKGGHAFGNSGVFVYPSHTTILRKFAYLSSAINYIAHEGISIENNAIKIVHYLRKLGVNPYDPKNKDHITAT